MTAALDRAFRTRREARDRLFDWPSVEITAEPRATTTMPTDPHEPTPAASRRDRGTYRGNWGNQVDERIDGDDFWGDAGTWADVAPHGRASHDTESGGRFGRWWKSATTAGSTGSRTHGTSGQKVAQDVAAWHDHEDHADGDVDAWEHERSIDGWDVEPAPVRGAGIDPLIARLGALIVVVTITASVVMGFTSGSDAGDQLLGGSAAATLETAETSTGVSIDASTAAGTPPTAAAPNVAATSELQPTTAAPDSIPASTAAPTTTEVTREAMLVASEPATTGPACGNEYELAAGDYWIRIADEADVELADLLDVNGATVGTLLVPGRSICLPVGAATPSPPTTVASTSPATTSPTATSSPTTTPSRPTVTTVAPAPTTTTAPRPAAVPASQAEAIIREVWPDDIEDRALEIARRESNYRSNVSNSCCYGLFQIHWSAHRSWLATIGVTSAAQLYDPFVNASAAYALYQRSGGFGPWGG